MSHYAVLVMLPGEIDPLDRNAVEAALAERLAPFNEELEVEPYKSYEDGEPWEYWYVKNRPEKADAKDEERFTRFLGENWRQRIEDRDITWHDVAAIINDAWSEDLTKYLVDERGMYHMTTYNPQSKWDWWQIGGRWRGYYPLKQGVLGAVGRPGVPEQIAIERGEDPNDVKGRADIARKGDIDLDGMRMDAAVRAGAHWDVYAKHWEGLERPPWTWEMLTDRVNDPDDGLDIETARLMWNEHSWNVARKAAEKEIYGHEMFFNDDNADQFGRDEYVQRAALQAAPPYATLDLEGNWLAPGEMGWWGISSDDESDRVSYAERVNEVIDTCDDDTVFVLVDMHI